MLPLLLFLSIATAGDGKPGPIVINEDGHRLVEGDYVEHVEHVESSVVTPEAAGTAALVIGGTGGAGLALTALLKRLELWLPLLQFLRIRGREEGEDSPKAIEGPQGDLDEATQKALMDLRAEHRKIRTALGDLSVRQSRILQDTAAASVADLRRVAGEEKAEMRRWLSEQRQLASTQAHTEALQENTKTSKQLVAYLEKVNV